MSFILLYAHNIVLKVKHKSERKMWILHLSIFVRQNNVTGAQPTVCMSALWSVC